MASALLWASLGYQSLTVKHSSYSKKEREILPFLEREKSFHFWLLPLIQRLSETRWNNVVFVLGDNSIQPEQISPQQCFLFPINPSAFPSLLPLFLPSLILPIIFLFPLSSHCFLPRLKYVEFMIGFRSRALWDKTRSF